jgi:hypothetical protein
MPFYEFLFIDMLVLMFVTKQSPVGSFFATNGAKGSVVISANCSPHVTGWSGLSSSQIRSKIAVANALRYTASVPYLDMPVEVNSDVQAFKRAHKAKPINNIQSF